MKDFVSVNLSNRKKAPKEIKEALEDGLTYLSESQLYMLFIRTSRN